MYSCTSEIQKVSIEIDGQLVTFVDTPGFDDTLLTDTEILTRISEWMTNSFVHFDLIARSPSPH